jgi:hypothetical protein
VELGGEAEDTFERDHPVGPLNEVAPGEHPRDMVIAFDDPREEQGDVSDVDHGGAPGRDDHQLLDGAEDGSKAVDQVRGVRRCRRGRRW